MGWPRKHLYEKGKKYPEPYKYNFVPYLPEDNQYTIKPLPICKLAGRDLETGRVVVRTRGGGNPKKFRWLDMVRKCNDDGSVKEEVVLLLKYDPLHTPKLALVADSERMRWIPASHEVEIGQVIRTHGDIPRNPVRAKNGDAHPIGALPTNTKVHLVETTPGAGAQFCVAAGSSALITKRAADGVTIKLPHGDMFKIDRECMAVVGQLSNVGHANVQWWVPQRTRWMGMRPRSGAWRRKDGYCGRKNHPPKMLDVTLAALAEKRAKETKYETYEL